MNAAVVSVAGVADAGLRSTIAATARMVARTFAVVFFSFVALAEILLLAPLIRRSRRAAVRAGWLHNWCRFACRVLGVNVKVRGIIPTSGLLVCNHLSYLDIIVISSLRPCVFVAKRDVKTWPLFGWLANAAGTIFADRTRKLASRPAVDHVRQAIENGVLVVLFPEGTSSDGASVLPFKSALLEPAVESHCHIAAAAISYSLTYGSVADEVCYWRDMTLVPHLLNLFTKRSIDAKLAISCYTASRTDRKELARNLRDQIEEMRS
jgi:1-acyl-sn-glycerol-3-phosphate acyltransferase